MDVLTAADARSVAFTARRKGYDEGEVDAFVDHVCDSLAEYSAQIEQLRADLQAAHAIINENQDRTDQSGAEKAELVAAAQSAAAERDLARAELDAVRAELTEAKQAAAQAADEAGRFADEAARLRTELDQAPKSTVTDSVSLLAAAQATADSLLATAQADTEKMREQMAAERDAAVAAEQARTQAALDRIAELRQHELNFRDELSGLLTHLSEAIGNGPVDGVENTLEQFRVEAASDEAADVQDEVAHIEAQVDTYEVASDEVGADAVAVDEFAVDEATVDEAASGESGGFFVAGHNAAPIATNENQYGNF